MKAHRRPLAVIALALSTTACPPPEDAFGPFAAGTTPNDVSLSRCGETQVALVADSGEAAVHAFDVLTGDAVATTRFEVDEGPDGERFASPWALAVSGNGTRAAVTLFGQDQVAWIDPCAGEVLSTATVEGARTPQPVVFNGSRVVAAFTNILRFGLDGEPPALEPGVVASFTVEGDVLELQRTATLDCLNPQGLAAFGADVLASCSGPLTRGADGGQAAIADGALVQLDAAFLEEKHVMAAGRLAPGTPHVRGDGRVIVGSLVDPAVCTAQGDDDVLSDCVTLDGPDVEAVFEVAPWIDEEATDVVLATQFSRDAIVVIGVTQGGIEVRRSIPVGPGGAAFRGLLAIDTRPGTSPVDAVALLGLSAEVVPLTLQKELP